MDNLKIENEVLNLLWENDCVILPDFGALIARTSEPSFNKHTHTFKPAMRAIFFNPSIKATDGLLANTIAEKFGIGYASSHEFILSEIAKIKLQIAKHEKVIWKNLGTFFGDDQKVFFIPAANANLLPSAYGLFPITLKPISSDLIIKEPADIKISVMKEFSDKKLVQVFTPEFESPLPIKNKKSIFYYLKWPVAAAMLACIVYAGIYNQDKIYYTKQEATILPNLLTNGAVISQQDDAKTLDTLNYQEKSVTDIVVAKNLSNNTKIDEINSDKLVNIDTIDYPLYNLAHRYHIVVAMSLYQETAIAEANSDETLYLLPLANSKLYRVAIYSTNELIEAKEKLTLLSNKYPLAKILDKNLYKNL